VRILEPTANAVLPPDAPLYIRAQSGAGDLRRIRFRVPGSGLFPEGLRTLAPEPNGAGEITWQEAKQLPPGRHTIEVQAFDESGNGGTPATVEFEKLNPSAPGAGGLAARFASVKFRGRGLSRTLSGAGLPGVLGGALRIEWQRKKGRRWIRYHAKTVIARRPYVVRQKLRRHGLWRVRLVYLGKPPVRKTASCWTVFNSRRGNARVVCPRGAVKFT
jgi:hypothetical protein